MQVRRPQGPGQPLGQSHRDSVGIHEMDVKRLRPTHLSRDNMHCSLCKQGLWHPAHRGTSVPPVAPQPSCSSPQTPGKTERCMVGDRAGLESCWVLCFWFFFLLNSGVTLIHLFIEPTVCQAVTSQRCPFWVHIAPYTDLIRAFTTFSEMEFSPISPPAGGVLQGHLTDPGSEQCRVPSKGSIKAAAQLITVRLKNGPLSTSGPHSWNL